MEDPTLTKYPLPLSPFRNWLSDLGDQIVSPEAVIFRVPADPAEIVSFLDQLFSQQMEEYHLARITAVVVENGQAFSQKGYSYSDLENQIPVDPDYEILFRLMDGLHSNAGRCYWIRQHDAEVDSGDTGEELGYMATEVKIAFPMSPIT